VNASLLDPMLLTKLQNVSGIYVDESKRQGLDRTVMITALNYAFLNHLQNSKCMLDRLGLRFLVMSFDSMLHSYLETNTSMISYLVGEGHMGNISTDHASLDGGEGSLRYNRITAKKVEVIYYVLEFNYDAVFFDVDIVFLADPLPYLIHLSVDYAHSVDKGLNYGQCGE
jgi:hypothetical protein